MKRSIRKNTKRSNPESQRLTVARLKRAVAYWKAEARRVSLAADKRSLHDLDFFRRFVGDFTGHVEMRARHAQEMAESQERWVRVAALELESADADVKELGGASLADAPDPVADRESAEGIHVIRKAAGIPAEGYWHKHIAAKD